MYSVYKINNYNDFCDNNGWGWFIDTELISERKINANLKNNLIYKTRKSKNFNKDLNNLHKISENGDIDNCIPNQINATNNIIIVQKNKYGVYNLDAIDIGSGAIIFGLMTYVIWYIF